MNVETFNAIAASMLKDFESHDVPGKLRKLLTAAQNRVNSPGEPSFPAQFDSQIAELRTVLPKLASNSFPPMWLEYLREIDCENWIGNNLLASIEAVLAANTITPTLALEAIKELSEEIDGDQTSLKGLVAAFRRFQIGKDLPAPGTAEVGVLIPRAAVHDNLSEFGAELRKLSRIVAVFRETVHGDRPDVKLKTIASSEFSILCQIDFETAKLIAKSVGNLIEGYKIVLGLKEQIQKLRSVGVPEENLKGLIDHANDKMKTTVNAVTEEIVTTFPDGKVEKTRRRELKIELTGALSEIASRIDSGFSFEIRAAKPAAPKDGAEEAPEAQEARQLMEAQVAEIAARQPSLQYLKTDGVPILSLPGLPDAAELRKAEATKPVTTQ